MATDNPTTPSPAVTSRLIQGSVPIDPAFVAALTEVIKTQQGKAAQVQPPEETAKQLVERLAQLQQSNDFKVGDLLTWKPGMSNKRLPLPGQPAIVLEVLSAPIIDAREPAGSPYYREPLDLLLGVIAEDGSFASFYYDKRRFAPFRSA